MGFTVVFRSKNNTGQPGVTTSTCFPSREAFLADIEKYLESDDVVAMGVTDDEAEQLCKQTPPFCYFYSALTQAFAEETGKFSRDLFNIEVMQMEFVTGRQCPDSLKRISTQLENGDLSVIPPIESFYMQ